MATRFTSVPSVGADKDLRSGIEAWTLSDPMRALVEAFDGDWDTLTRSADGLAGRLSALDVFSDRWDTRQGRERNLAPELPMSGGQAELVMAAAEALGLREVRPPRHREYDHVLMLGGLIRACLTRPEHAARLIRDGVVQAGAVTALGGHRPFDGDEFKLAALAGVPDLAEEYEALDAGTRLAFDLDKPEHVEGETSDTIGGTWGIRGYRAPDGLAVTVAAAPSSDPVHRRANTPDTFAWFAERFAVLRPGQRLLLVTNAIYVPPQNAAALRMLALPYEVEVDTVGGDPRLVAPALQQPFTPTKYLLEVRSTLRALRALLAALEDTAAQS